MDTKPSLDLSNYNYCNTDPTYKEEVGKIIRDYRGCWASHSMDIGLANYEIEPIVFKPGGKTKYHSPYKNIAAAYLTKVQEIVSSMVKADILEETYNSDSLHPILCVTQSL